MAASGSVARVHSGPEYDTASWAPDSLVMVFIRYRNRLDRPSAGPSTRLGRGSAPGANTPPRSGAPPPGSVASAPPALVTLPVWVIPASHIGLPSLPPAWR